MDNEQVARGYKIKQYDVFTAIVTAFNFKDMDLETVENKIKNKEYVYAIPKQQSMLEISNDYLNSNLIFRVFDVVNITGEKGLTVLVSKTSKDNSLDPDYDNTIIERYMKDKDRVLR